MKSGVGKGPTLLQVFEKRSPAKKFKCNIRKGETNGLVLCLIFVKISYKKYFLKILFLLKLTYFLIFV